MRCLPLLLATALSFTTAASAMEPRPLPDFAVYGADGAPRPSALLAPGSHWLLVYATPDCTPCRRLLELLAGWRSSTAVLAGTVLVVGAPTDQARDWLRQALPPELAGLTWYADADATAWEELQLDGAPVVMGVERGRIVWTAAGLLTGAGVLRPAVQTWLDGAPPR
jgi:hypothetical protein